MEEVNTREGQSLPGGLGAAGSYGKAGLAWQRDISMTCGCRIGKGRGLIRPPDEAYGRPKPLRGGDTSCRLSTHTILSADLLQNSWFFTLKVVHTSHYRIV